MDKKKRGRPPLSGSDSGKSYVLNVCITLTSLEQYNHTMSKKNLSEYIRLLIDKDFKESRKS